MTGGKRSRSVPARPDVLPLAKREPVNPLEGKLWLLGFPDLEEIEKQLRRVPRLRGRERDVRFLLGWIDLQANAYIERVSLRNDLYWGYLNDRINAEITANQRGVVSAEVAEYQETQRNRGRGASYTPRERRVMVWGIAYGFRMLGLPVRLSPKSKRSKPSPFVNIVEIVLRAAGSEHKNVYKVVREALAKPLRQSEPMEPMVIERILPPKAESAQTQGDERHPAWPPISSAFSTRKNFAKK